MDVMTKGMRGREKKEIRRREEIKVGVRGVGKERQQK